MGVLGEGSRWCFCSGGGRSERVKGGIFCSKGPALAAIYAAGGGSGGGVGTGFLIHRNLLLTTHANLPSAAATEAAEIRLCHDRLPARLAPQRFFITSSVLDLTIVGLDILDSDSPSEVQQPRYLKTCFNPNIDLGNVVYLLGHTDKKELAVGEGKVVIATDNLIKLFIDGVAWCPGSAGFDVHGNLAFMVCDPMKLASSPTGRSASSSSSLSWKKDTSMQFGIPIPVICDWLHQHWEGSLDEVSKPKLSKIRSMPTGQKSGNSCASFTLRRVFKAFEEVNDNILSSSPVNRRSKFQLGSSCSANSNAMFSHDENMAIDLSCTHEQGIPTPEIFESPKLISGPLQKKQYAPIQLLDINFPPRAPRSIILPPPLKQVLSDEDNVRGSEPGNVLREYDLSPKDVPQASREGKYKLPPIGTWQEDRCSVQSSSSPLEISELQHEGNGFGSEEDTMYSAETMESRNIPTPKETNLQQVGRSQSCVNYSRWTSTRRMPTAQRSASQKQRALTPACKTQSQTSALPQRSHDFHSSKVSSNMKRNSLENPRRPRRSTVQKPQRWMF
ncbi:unnamed protein product [Musa acuminata subsp. malaccensis]|uniref:(wild Malaysian banana) hypothetical protein n=1 Tax=Musa acuminata subsp. malaccensis TaxID=214687 RepID=A0A804J971_MUSAM|nr:PREDICTED: uncharacterized protein LOC103986441 [Musa acuminata subsp. malaccensis]CAG1840004.1 unnamed protein product [Musa acuminata subsp. malaccensis]